MDLKVSLDYVETEESKYRRNAAIQIQQEVANVLKYAKLSEANKAAEAETAKEEKEGKKAEKTPAAKPEKKQEAAQEKKSFEKKPFEKKGKWGDFRGGYRKDPNPDVIYEGISKASPFLLRVLSRRWARSLSAARLWKWKRGKYETRKLF